MENAIELEHISLSIDGKQILKDISFSVPKGSFAGILGANGAGKTTLLKCINGIYPCRGQVRVCGRDRSSCTGQEFARLVSLMNQNTNLEFAFTCRQVVEFGRYPYWKRGLMSNPGDKEIVDRVMKETNTDALADMPITNISGGERQRVFFAKILAQDTDVILLDEATANLDLYYQRQLFSFGRDLARKGKTVLAVVHDLNLALQYCEQFYLLSQGQLLAQGSAREVMSQKNMWQAYHLDTLLYENPCIHQMELSALDKSQTLQNLRIHVLGQDGKLLYDLWRQGAQLSVCADCQNLTMAQIYGIPAMDDSQAIRELLEAKERGKIPVVLDLDGKTDRILEIPHFFPNTPQGGQAWQKFIETT